MDPHLIWPWVQWTHCIGLCPGGSYVVVVSTYVPTEICPFFQPSYSSQWITWAPSIPKESFIREAPLIDMFSGGTLNGSWFFIPSAKRLYFALAICCQDRHLKNSEELIYVKISGISMGLMWTCFGVWYPNGFVCFTSSWYLYGSNFWLGRHTPQF